MRDEEHYIPHRPSNHYKESGLSLGDSFAKQAQSEVLDLMGEESTDMRKRKSQVCVCARANGCASHWSVCALVCVCVRVQEGDVCECEWVGGWMHAPHRLARRVPSFSRVW